MTLDKWLEEVEAYFDQLSLAVPEPCIKALKLIAIVRRQQQAVSEIEDLPPLQERERRTIARACNADVERLVKDE